MKTPQWKTGRTRIFLLAASVFFLLASGLWGQALAANTPAAPVPSPAPSTAAPQTASSAPQLPQILIKDLVHVEG
ncbi:MAG: hypothetical protein HKM06_05195, partial [Spirochaetales bacterium]|nr:hypothetical protein [Spirochaetales bacterium]